MSRVTPPVTKLTSALRSISTSASRSSNVAGESRHVSIYLPRKVSDLRAECNRRQLKSRGSKLELVDRLTAHDVTDSRDFHTSGGHRPTSTPQSLIPIIPPMQGFKTSAPKAAAHDHSTIDFFFFPAVPEPAPSNPFSKLRVPLLPDNYHPDRSPNSPHAVETLDSAIPPAEIHIVASHPEQVLPVAMSEVVGNDGVDVAIEEWTAGVEGSRKAEKKAKEPGVLKELWSGLMEDMFGKGPKAAV